MTPFQHAAGLSADQLSHFIRVVLCTLFFIWASWNIYGQFRLVNQGDDVFEFPISVLRILFLCALMVVLVFVP